MSPRIQNDLSGRKYGTVTDQQEEEIQMNERWQARMVNCRRYVFTSIIGQHKAYTDSKMHIFHDFLTKLVFYCEQLDDVIDSLNTRCL